LVATTGLAVSSNGEGGLRQRVGIVEHNAGDAVGESDFDSRLAVAAEDAERRGAVGADAEPGAQDAGAIEDAELRDASAGDVELAASIALGVDEHELLRGHQFGGCGGVNGASGKDMARHCSSDERGGESQRHKPDSLFDGHGGGLLSVPMARRFPGRTLAGG
jgi:hypothetical protein